MLSYAKNVEYISTELFAFIKFKWYQYICGYIIIFFLFILLEYDRWN